MKQFNFSFPGTIILSIILLSLPTITSGQNTKEKSTRIITDVCEPLDAGSIKIGGWLGGRMEACLTRRAMIQNIDRMVDPFIGRYGGSWDSEYWGKWYTSAVFGYLYQPTPKHKEKIDLAVSKLLKTQTPDGQITGFNSADQLGYNWDLWGRKYALLGLIAHYDATGDVRSLKAAERATDFIIEQVNKGMVIGERCFDSFKGVQSTSILAEFAMLYARTKNERYRKVAELIVRQFDIPNKIAPKGLRLMSDALANKAPFEIGSRKSYEVLANYEALLELYRATGDKRYFQAALNYVEKLLEQERMIHGSLSNNEQWFYGVKNQTGILEQPVETCVTAQWMLTCWQLLRLTGDPKWADELELSLFNSLSGAMTPEGHWWSYFAHLNGERIPTPFHHDKLKMTCCVASGPRGLLLTPQWAVMKEKEGIMVNLYGEGSARVRLDNGVDVSMLQETSYPESGQVNITVNPQKTAKFKMKFRIPSWSKLTTMSVNGQSVSCSPGKYVEVNRTWAKGDKITLTFDMRVRSINAPSGSPDLALARGPVLLALDNRMVVARDTAVYIDVDKDGYVRAKQVQPVSSKIWMAFEIPVYTRSGIPARNEQFHLIFCDYPSAGNEWSATNLFRTWLPQPLYLSTAFPNGIWKLAYWKRAQRPGMPSFDEVGR